uniref:Orotidine 5'-phosphate decarboxylase n=1 Tax=Geoglobus ahangari TaxID=113653 RepID=A0A7C4S8D1_9EURY
MLILALDVLNEKKAMDIAADVRDYISMIKVNYPLVLSSGIGIIEKLSKIKPVIADFKIADIPYTSSLIAEIAFENRAKAVTTHGFVGKDVIEAVKKVAGRYDGEVYVVTELSSKGGREFMAKVSEKIVEIANETGCDGLIVPATRPERIKEIRSKTSLKLIAPGVITQGGEIKDTLDAGADGIIVGRAIYNAKDPKEEAKKIWELIKKYKKI